MLNSKAINPSPAVELDNGNVMSLSSAFHKEQQSTIITKTSISNLSNVFGNTQTQVDYQITPHTSIDKCNFAVIELDLECLGKSTGSLLGPVWNLIDHIDYLINSKTVDTIYGANLFQELSYLDSNQLAIMAQALGFDPEDFYFPANDSLIGNTSTVIKRFIPLLKGPLTTDINWKAVKSTMTIRVTFKKLSDITTAGAAANSFDIVANPTDSIRLSNTQLTMAGVVYPAEITNSIITDHYTNKNFVAPVFGRRTGIFNLGNSLDTSASPKTVELSQFKGTFSNISFFCNLQNNLIENSYQSKLNAAIPTVSNGSIPSYLVINKTAAYPWVNLKYSPNSFMIENIVLLDSTGSVGEFTAQNSGTFIKSAFDIPDQSPFNSTYSIYNLNYSDNIGGMDGDFSDNAPKSGSRYIDGLYNLQLYFPNNISAVTFDANVILNVVALQECSIVVRNGMLDYIRH